MSLTYTGVRTRDQNGNQVFMAKTDDGRSIRVVVTEEAIEDGQGEDQAKRKALEKYASGAIEPEHDGMLATIWVRTADVTR